MELSSTNINGAATVVSIAGSVDALTVDEMTGYLTEQIRAGGRRMIADLSRVKFISSSGLRALVNATKETRKQGGDFRLAAPQAGVAKMLRMSGLIHILKTYPTVNDAVSSFFGAGRGMPAD